MNIVWIADKHLDVSVDRATWTETVRNLVRRGHRILLVTGHKTKNPPDFGLSKSIRYLSSSERKGIAFFSFHFHLFAELVYILISRKPDVLIFHPFTCLTVLPFLVFHKIGLLGTRFVLDVRTLPVEFRGANAVFSGWLFDLSMKCSRYLCDGTTVITSFMQKVLSHRYRLTAQRMGIWTSGASEELFSPNRTNRISAPRLRKFLRIGNQFVLIYHGVFSMNRGLQETLKAISLLNKKHRDILLLLVGQGAAKPLLAAMTEKMDLQDHVRMIGPVPLEEIPGWIAISDAGVLPFPPLLWWRVSSPIKLMEYMAMGKPVVVTDIEAHRDVLEGCRGAFFVPSHRPEHLAGGILEAYCRRRILPRLGRECRERFQDRYTWSMQTLRLETYLNSLVCRAQSR